MTDKTYPKPFLSDDSDGGLRITNLVVENDKLSFDINITTTGVESEQEPVLSKYIWKAKH